MVFFSLAEAITSFGRGSGADDRRLPAPRPCGQRC
jgi:hypothetical protein